MKILIAEDDDIYRVLICSILKGEGYEVLAAPDGKVAWERLLAEGAEMGIFDIDMPGMTGIELLKRIRAHKGLSGLPVIMLTVKALVEDQLAGYGAGADDYVPKLGDISVLLARVELLARKARGRG